MSRLDHDIALVRASALLDAGWYLARYPEVPGIGIDAAEHYVRIGAMLQRDPGPCFSTRRYLDAYADVAAAGINPLVHYLTLGEARGYRAFPVTDAETSRDDRLAGQDNVSSAYAATGAGGAEWQRDAMLIAGSGLFDTDHYLACNKDVLAAGMDPLRHFVRYGASEGRAPNPWFSIPAYRTRYQRPDDRTNPLVHYIKHPQCWDARTSNLFDGAYYRARYADVRGAGMPPLQHFLLIGLDEGREGARVDSTMHIVDVRAIRTTVIVPVFNAVHATDECIRSVLRHTRFGEQNRLLIVDDASTDPAVGELLRTFGQHPGVSVVRNPVNVGYTGTVNAGCAWAGRDDVVLLNSDTVVGPHWLRNLKVAAYRKPRLGTVTAVSNNAGEFSVPCPGPNGIPDGLGVEDMSRIVSSCVNFVPIEVVTGNGFCLYIKRALMDDIGAFDEKRFPVGYGEENDFCMRALDAGWYHEVDPRTWIAHERSASFGERRQQLASTGMQQLDQLYPEYAGAVRVMRMSRPFQIARSRIGRRIRQAVLQRRKVGPRVMFVISTRSGGTPQTNADLMRALSDDYECLALWCNRHVVEVLAVKGDGYRTLQQFTLSEPVRFAMHVSGEYDEIAKAVMLEWNIELLHIRHLAWHSLNLPEVARSLDIPVVHSFHDFYAICPTFTLVDADGAYHPAGVAGNSRNPLWDKDPTDTGMNEKWLQRWQERMQRALSHCAAFVTTSRSAQDVLAGALPLLASRETDFRIIPHGRDFAGFMQAADVSEPRPGMPLRVLLPGNIGLAKGMSLVMHARQLDTEGKIEFHLLGTCDPAMEGCVVDHGRYRRADFADMAASIRPHVALVASVWPETWCHTLTECWACGVPVVGIDIGAIGERIRRHGGGWLLDFPADGQSLYRELLRLLGNVAERRRKVAEVEEWQRGEGLRNTTQCMARQYASLYQGIMSPGQSRHT